MRSILWALTLLSGSLPLAALSAQESTGPLSADDRVRVAHLMERAIEAGRREADAARIDKRLSEDDRRDVQSQFALLLMRADRCEKAAHFVRNRDEIMASGIERLLFGTSIQEDPSCVTALAALMVDRWDDPYFNPAGRIALRHKAAAYLDAAEIPGAKAIMNDAERELFDMGWGATNTLWRSRLEALAVYRGSAKRLNYLEEVGSKMLAERLHFGSSEANQLLTILAGAGRCDLVEAFVRNGPTSCEKYIAWSKPLKVAKTYERQIEIEHPQLTDKTIDIALSQKTPWDRITQLLRFVSAVNRALRSTNLDYNTEPPTKTRLRPVR